MSNPRPADCYTKEKTDRKPKEGEEKDACRHENNCTCCPSVFYESVSFFLLYL